MHLIFIIVANKYSDRDKWAENHSSTDAAMFIIVYALCLDQLCLELCFYVLQTTMDWMKRIEDRTTFQGPQTINMMFSTYGIDEEE